ncbi:probable serine/threonine-protein kinase PBL26 [Rutidosis leptorrhynchoides]|uniref:probable serine/threonine-protein kinase PBL26 n=1 Tax=Rutidosis leptorrhynchoides TaxID=125765 RepID=UPI003A98E654
MNCLPCFGNKESESSEQEILPVAQTKGQPSSNSPVKTTDSPLGSASQAGNQKQKDSVAIDINETDEVAISSARNFGFRDMAMATKNFRRETLLGESRVGKVYKGTLPITGQVVAVKQLDRHGTKANKEFLAEVMMLSLVRHPNLVELIGYCADGDQRILVYEYMKMGSLKNHLHEIPPEKEPLDWITRMKIASGAAQGLEYLHDKANPPILYCNFASTSILLDEKLEPKLTDYGLTRLEIETENAMQNRMVHRVGCAPEYEQNGELTPKSDVYSFGVVLLELITGRKALDTTRSTEDQNLVIWAQPYFKDPKKFPEMADPKLNGAFPDKSLNQAVGVAAMCVQDDSSVRPMMSDVAAALSFLTMPPVPQPQADPAPSTNDHDKTQSSGSSSADEKPKEENVVASGQNHDDDDSEDFSDYSDDDDDEQINIRVKHQTGGTSSSESLYNEDDYSEDESQQEEISYRTKSKPKSIKRKVTLGIERGSVSRNSSKRDNKSFKTRSGTSMRKKSMNIKSSRNGSEPCISKNKSSSRSNKSFNTNLDSSLSRKSVGRKYSKNNGRIDGNSIKKGPTNTFEDDQKLSSRRSKSKQIENGESSESSFSSDDGDNSKKVVAFESSRTNFSESNRL